MLVKYTQYKQTCQTLQQNAVQLNKRVTTKWGKLTGLMLLSSMLIFLLLYLVPNHSSAGERTIALQSSIHSTMPIIIEPMVDLATKDDGSATQLTVPQPVLPQLALPQLTQQWSEPITMAAASRILLATPTAVGARQHSPLPTPPLPTPPLPTPMIAQIVALSTTVELQNQVAISVAMAAQSLFASLQQPLQRMTHQFSTQPVTTTSGALPPLVIPTVDLVPVDLVPVDLVPVELSPQQTPAPRPAFTSSVVPPQLQSDGQPRTVQVPVLMYHYLSEPPSDADIYRRDLSVTPALFAAHLDRMIAEGYTIISLYDLAAYLLQGTPLPSKAVVITFDDGYRDNYENAFPLLRERGITATFFVVIEFINQERPEYLTWPMVQEMAAAGMPIEAHGIDHTTLRGRSHLDLEFQALRSYETLQNAVGLRARFVSYPAGEFDEQTIEVFQEAGYWAGFTTVQGATHRSDELFRLPRVRMRGTTSPDELARLLALDW